MKMRFLAGLVGLAISFSVPVLAREKDTVDPQMAEQIRAFYQKFDEEFNKGDAAGVAAFYTGDAVYVTPHGTFSGRQAIQKSYAEYSFRQWHSHNQDTKVDRITAVGNEIRSIGKWSCNFQDQAGNADHIEGHYSSVLIRDGDSWKIRKDTYSEFAPKSQASAQGVGATELVN